MKHASRIAWLALCVMLIFTLSACGKEEQTSIPATDPTHFYEEVRDGFLIDAEISSMPDHSVPKVYEGHRKVISHEEIDDFLAFLGDATAETETKPHFLYDNLTDYSYFGTCTSGNRFYQCGCAEENLSNEFQYFDSTGNIYYSSYPIYVGQRDYDENAGLRLAYLFMEPKDFVFATAQEAERRVREALSKLGLEDLRLNRTLYLDHQGMAEAWEILQEPEWASIKGDSYPQNKNWSEEDDGYMFEFFYTIHGLPLCYKHLDMDTMIYLGGSIQVWYRANKIVFLWVDEPWTAGEVVAEPGQIISAEAALTLARDKLGAVATYRDLVINKVSLEYMYAQDKDRWVLTPVWIVSGQHSSQWIPDSVETECVIIDAVTGKEI